MSMGVIRWPEFASKLTAVLSFLPWCIAQRDLIDFQLSYQLGISIWVFSGSAALAPRPALSSSVLDQGFGGRRCPDTILEGIQSSFQPV